MTEDATRTFLELCDRAMFRPARVNDPRVRIDRVHECPPSFWRYLYAEVGRAYRWVDRLPWSDEDIRRYLSDPAVSLWLMTVASAPAGYFELRHDDSGSVEIAYFGLLGEFTGRGLGGHLLSAAVDQAWALGANRVWLHTCTFDHQAALPNYLRRGFRAYKTERF